MRPPQQANDRTSTRHTSPLGELRGLDADHPAVRLHLLASLTSQTQALLPDTMLEADSLGYHLNEIIVLLNLA